VLAAPALRTLSGNYNRFQSRIVFVRRASPGWPRRAQPATWSANGHCNDTTATRRERQRIGPSRGPTFQHHVTGASTPSPLSNNGPMADWMRCAAMSSFGQARTLVANALASSIEDWRMRAGTSAMSPQIERKVRAAAASSIVCFFSRCRTLRLGRSPHLHLTRPFATRAEGVFIFLDHFTGFEPLSDRHCR
jgi:hypothetical protein